MRTVVTGSEGFIGARLARKLEARGDQVYRIDVVDPPDRLGLPRGVLDPQLVDRFAEVQPQVVFHLAGQPDAERSMVDPVGDAELNVLGTVHVTKALIATGSQDGDRYPKLVFPATWQMYRPYQPGQVGGTLYHETTPWDPWTVYGVSKMAAVRYLQVLAPAFGIDYGVAVLGNVYGPGGDNVVRSLARNLIDGRDSWVRDADSRDFVWVDDAVDALIKAGDTPGSQVCNVGSGVETGLLRLWDRLAALTGVDPSGPALDIRPGGIRCRLSTGRARELWGWEATIDLDGGLGHVVDGALAEPVT